MAQKDRSGAVSGSCGKPDGSRPVARRPRTDPSAKAKLTSPGWLLDQSAQPTSVRADGMAQKVGISPAAAQVKPTSRGVPEPEFSVSPKASVLLAPSAAVRAVRLTRFGLTL